MQLIKKAIWHIEGHLDEDLRLDDLAQLFAVTPFHLARAFQRVTGQSLMHYVRRRKLSVAFDNLRKGMTVMQAALAASYNSQAAFSRAFRVEFGITPARIRTLPQTDFIPRQSILEFSMTGTKINISHRFESHPQHHFIGLVRRLSKSKLNEIPGQWEAFNSMGYKPRSRVGKSAFGVCFNDKDAGFDYLCGYETATPEADQNLKAMSTPATRYFILATQAHIANIASVISTGFERLEAAGEQIVQAPMIEHYGPSFDPQTGQGGFEIWMPIAAA